MMNNLVSYEQGVKSSSAYIAFVILQNLEKNGYISMLDVHDCVKKKANYNYSNTIYGLILLFSTGIIEFNSPNICLKK